VLFAPNACTADAVPALHRLVAGAVLTVVPLTEPHAPFTGCGPDEHVAVVPPSRPRQLHPYCPCPDDTTDVAFPAAHRLVVGSAVEVDPFALPHTPLVPASGTRQSATPPPLLPRHAHAHGPVPDTGDAVPVAHRFVDGAALTATPFADPHCPPVPEFTGAEHCTVVPVPLPAQLQFQGPVPVTVEGVPALHRLPAGATVVITPFAGPHCPFTGAAGAEQLADVPPPIPAQFQFHGPLPVTVEGVPALHSPPEGAASAVTPFADPHAPFACTGAEHWAVVPP
jgi:hypothetical protein